MNKKQYSIEVYQTAYRTITVTAWDRDEAQDLALNLVNKYEDRNLQSLLGDVVYDDWEILEEINQCQESFNDLDKVN